jgi:hypothetical protein
LKGFTVFDNGGELFGNNMKKQNGATATDGFDALGDFDENRDGVVDARDAVWPRLRLWTDLNHDGFTNRASYLPRRRRGLPPSVSNTISRHATTASAIRSATRVSSYRTEIRSPITTCISASWSRGVVPLVTCQDELFARTDGMRRKIVTRTFQFHLAG